MATYVYHCDQCDVDIERRYKMGAQPDRIECDACGCEARRVYTAAAVHYKGFGWADPGHGEPDMDEREKMPGRLEFDDLMEG